MNANARLVSAATICWLLVLLGPVTLVIAADRPEVKAAPKPLNILFITVDDMSCDSIGAFGCKLPDTSPTVDRLAAEGLRFQHAHTQVGNCMPTRNVIFSGRYPHTNGVEGFRPNTNPGYPVAADLMKAGGYFCGIRGKVSHSTPYHPYPAWDLVLDELPDGKPAHPKNAESYGISTKHGIDSAKAAGKPFFLVINVSDPHKPFYAEAKSGATIPDPNVPSRVFTPEEVPVPGFLFDDPVVRKELAHYYSSVRRADDSVRYALEALKASGEEENTVILFLSDHGMPLPFAKTQLYHHSTRTPWIVKWPGVTKANSIDDTHMISGVDFLPSILEITGLKAPDGLQGRSFVPLLKGQKQDGRDMIVKEYNENSGGDRSPMRAVQTKTHLYIFNPWSDGTRVMASATKGTPTYRRMQTAAKTDPAIAERLDLMDHRVLEEAFDVVDDPDCLENLIDDSGSQVEITRLRSALEAWMKETGDPMLEVFQKRDNAEVREAFMAQMKKEQAEAAKAKKAAGKGKGKNKKKADPGDDE